MSRLLVGLSQKNNATMRPDGGLMISVLIGGPMKYSSSAGRRNLPAGGDEPPRNLPPCHINTTWLSGIQGAVTAVRFSSVNMMGSEYIKNIILDHMLYCVCRE